MKRTLVATILAACAVGLLVEPAAGQRRSILSADLLAPHGHGRHLHRVIVQGDLDTVDGLTKHGLGVLRRRLGESRVMDVTDDQLDALERNGAITHISGDVPVHATSAIVNQVTGASTVWQGTRSLLFSKPGYTGAGIVVAVVDSGIASHSALSNRVLTHVNFVSNEPGVTGDPYGHGTHVAAIIAGSTTSAKYVTSEYAGGSAPDAKLVDVRVLGRDGAGLTSDVIAGIDWAVANRATYGIRIINLSLGHPVTEPSLVDPLCQAVARAVNAGITVIAAAGNYGVTSTGAPVLGGITSPGNSPYAITVGAIDMKATLSTSDDVVASYSSKGPAEYELVVKPDIAAPGSSIVSAEAQGSYLSTTYPQFHIAGSGTNAYMRLSGTSMSTAVVSGGAALLLDAQPKLSPEQVKMALQMGARYMRDAGLQGGGAGSVYFPQSLTVSQNGLLTNLLTTVTSILGVSSGAAFRDDGTLTDRLYGGTGLRLLGLLDLSWLFQSGGEWGVLNLLGLGNPLASIPPNWLVWGQVAGWTNSYAVVWGSTIYSPTGQAVVWGSSDVTDGEAFVWGSSVVGGDAPQ